MDGAGTPSIHDPLGQSGALMEALVPGALGLGGAGVVGPTDHRSTGLGAGPALPGVQKNLPRQVSLPPPLFPSVKAHPSAELSSHREEGDTDKQKPPTTRISVPLLGGVLI